MAPKVYPVRLQFLLAVDTQRSVEHFSHAYIVVGERLCIVDSGVAGSQPDLFEALAALGRSPADVAWVVNTHEHPDHIGGNGFLHRATSAEFACHGDAVRWIEDLELQYRERPIYGFQKLVGEAIRVVRRLNDGDVLDLGGGTTLQVLFTPGHSPGSIALYCPEDGTLIAGDTLQPVGGLPLYIDLPALRASLARLAALPGVQTLLCAHAARPLVGAEIPAAFQASLAYIDRVDGLVHQVVRELGVDAAPEEITCEVLLRLGMPPPSVMPITVASIMAHLQ